MDNASENRFLLSKFCNLKKLELIYHPCISFETLIKVICNNPALESLCIKTNRHGHSTFSAIISEYSFKNVMLLLGDAHFLGSPIQLKEFAYSPVYYLFADDFPDDQIMQQPDYVVDRFIDSLKHLESLALTLSAVYRFTNAVERNSVSFGSAM